MGVRIYNQVKKTTDKMNEARKVVDKFIGQTNRIPSYNVVARKLNIDHSTAYYRLRGYRDKMKTKSV